VRARMHQTAFLTMNNDILTTNAGFGMKMQEVRAKAKALGLKNTFGLSKVELIRRIQRAEGNFDCFGTAKDYCDQFECCFREDCIKPSSQ